MPYVKDNFLHVSNLKRLSVHPFFPHCYSPWIMLSSKMLKFRNFVKFIITHCSTIFSSNSHTPRVIHFYSISSLLFFARNELYWSMSSTINEVEKISSTELRIHQNIICDTWCSSSCITRTDRPSSSIYPSCCLLYLTLSFYFHLLAWTA